VLWSLQYYGSFI